MAGSELEVVRKRRILITGLASFWGGQMAQALEQDPRVEVIVGLDGREPKVALERTEFVHADETFSILDRIVRATRVDTVVHAGLVVDSATAERRIHEYNVIGTLNLLAAITAGDSAVRSLVVKSSTLVYGASARDPYFFDEQTSRTVAARTPIERSLLEVEEHLSAFALDNPSLRVATLRFANVLGPDIETGLSRLLTLPLVPRIAGFSPQVQFVSQADVVRALQFAVDHDVAGFYNVAGSGRLPWSEVAAVVGRPPLLLSPVGTGLLSAATRLFGFYLPPELLDLLRFGRGVDTRKFEAAGFTYRDSTLEALQRFVEDQRLKAVVGDTSPTYRYEADVEAFFRRSPAVIRPS